jgi:hypothetical protein
MLRTILIIATVVVVLGALAGGGYYWYTSQHAETPSPDITEVPIQQREGLGEIPEATGIEPELGALPGDSDRAIEAPAGEAELLGEPSLETGPSPGDIETVEGPETGDLEGTQAGGDISAPLTTATQPPRETRPADNTETRPVAESAVSAEVAETSPTPTPQPETTSPTPTVQLAPTATPKPTPAPGSYSVRTLQAVPEAKLAEVRQAMSALNVTLQEQRTGQYHIQAYKLALGYFRTKAEAESWASSNLKPKGVDYFVYQTQNMFSIQVGVYANPQNVDRAQRSLYEKFPGWRLPLRREVVNLSRNAYILSISKIHPNLADQIWRKLNQLGIQAEIIG